jgi:hypothetical protein
MKEKRTKAIITGAVLVCAIALIVLLARGSSGGPTIVLPEDFVRARQNASQVSQRIVDLTTFTAGKIAAANTSNGSGNVSQTETLINEARSANDEAYRSASDLASYLKDLAGSLSTIQSVSSQRLAFEAIATEMSLVSEFIVYTQNLNDFLDNLSLFVKPGSSVKSSEVNAALQKTNKSAERINDLNEEFNTRMTRFDKSL